MGVEEGRLESKGFGTANPIVEGHSIDANRQNRRVEFVITELRR
jgi:outer membrane protein OmpA-like peptidoglycan-associated protein